jgi:hypothetical protein
MFMGKTKPPDSRPAARENSGLYSVSAIEGRSAAGCDAPMKIAGYDFEHVGDIKPVCEKDGLIQQFMPQSRYQNARNLPLNKYGAGPFCRFRIPNGFRASGVYVLTIDDEIRYVGECTNLSSRFNNGYGNISPKNCFKGGQETNCRLNNLVYVAAMAGERISLWFFQTKDHKAMEVVLRSTMKLAWNRV